MKLSQIQIKDGTLTALSKLVLALNLLAITGCVPVEPAPQWEDVSIVGSGNIVSQTRPLSDFTRIEAGLIFDLAIQQGDEYRVVVVADDNWVDYLSTEVVGTTLVLDYIDGYAYNVSGVTTRVEITMPELVGLNLSSSAHAALGGFQAMLPLEVQMTGSTYLNGTLFSDVLNLKVNGGSFVDLNGASHTINLDICGSSLVNLSELEVDRADVELACSDITLVQVHERLTVDAAQNAQLYYVGSPAKRMLNVYESAAVLPYTE
jgi:hypothetical protein